MCHHGSSSHLSERQGAWPLKHGQSLPNFSRKIPTSAGPPPKSGPCFWVNRLQWGSSVQALACLLARVKGVQQVSRADGVGSKVLVVQAAAQVQVQ